MGEVDREGGGQINFDGYLRIVLNKMAERPSHSDILKAFRLFDTHGKKALDVSDLRRIADSIGEQIDDSELQAPGWYCMACRNCSRASLSCGSLAAHGWAELLACGLPAHSSGLCLDPASAQCATGALR